VITQLANEGKRTDGQGSVPGHIDFSSLSHTERLWYPSSLG